MMQSEMERVVEFMNKESYLISWVRQYLPHYFLETLEKGR
jgi:hypothetical protein